MSITTRRISRAATGLAVFAALATALLAGDARPAPAPFKGVLDVSVLEARGVSLAAANHRGRSAVRAVIPPGSRGETIAVVNGSSFLDGTIEADVAGQPEAGASGGARGFVGLAFRVADALAGFECFYIRPTNGRADDQVRRNHSTQYISFPGFPWEKLRKESPSVYESYVDLEPGAWTHLKIEVAGSKARLYVNRADQPTLIVNDLKREPAAGPVALWIGSETEGWFSNLVIAPKGP